MPLASTSVLHYINGARTRQDPFKLLFWTNRLPSLLFPEGPGSPTEGPAGLSVMVLNFETSPFVPTIICWDMYWVQFRRVLPGISNKWPADWYIHLIFAKMFSKICICLLCKSNKLTSWGIMHLYKRGYSKKWQHRMALRMQRNWIALVLLAWTLKEIKQFSKFF